MAYDGDVDKESDEVGKVAVADLPAVHARAIIRHGQIALATQDQRLLSLAARRFVSIPGAQWEGAGFAEMGSNMIRVEINKTARGLEKIDNDYRANRMTVDFRAVGGKSSKHTSMTLKGMHRADAYHFKAQQARDNAFAEGSSGGFGAWRLCCDYADHYDEESDEQRINPGMTIVDADQSVFFDLNSKLYDKSDARFAFVVTALSRQAFEEDYPDASGSWPNTAIKPYYDWYTPDVIRIAEYYEVEEHSEKLVTYRNPVSGDEERFFPDELDKQAAADMMAQGWVVASTRKVKRRRIHKYLMSGSEVLGDEGLIAGDCIPIVPYYGKRWFIDNVERWRGHVQNAMDPARILNAQASKLVETSALQPRQIPILTPEQIQGHETRWANQNVERHPYALLNPILGVDGNPMPAGPIGMLTPPDVPPVTAALIQLAAGFVDELTQSADPAADVRSNVSAQAMEIAATRVDAMSGTYMDNFRQSVQREGEIYLSMARAVYYQPERVVDTMDDNGSDGQETLMQPYTDEMGNFSIRNDLTSGKYNVIADVTEATATRRDKTVRAMLNIASVSAAAQDMETSSAAIITAVLNMDGEGIDDFQAFMRKRALNIGLVKPTEDEKRAAEAASQNAPQDPNAAVAQSQALALTAVAKKDSAMADKLVADTELSKAKTMQTLAEAHKTVADMPHDAKQAEAQHLATLADAHATMAHADTASRAGHSKHMSVVNDIMRSQEGASSGLTPDNSQNL